MLAFLKSWHRSSPGHSYPPRRQPAVFRPVVEPLEDWVVPAITDMTALAQLFHPHAAPTRLFLNFGAGPVSYQDSNCVKTTETVASYQPRAGGNRSDDIAAITAAVSTI